MIRGRVSGGESQTESTDLDMYSRISTNILNLVYMKGENNERMGNA